MGGGEGELDRLKPVARTGRLKPTSGAGRVAKAVERGQDCRTSTAARLPGSTRGSLRCEADGAGERELNAV